MSLIRISASGGVYQWSNRMASGDTIIRHNAKSRYDGRIARLNSAHCASGLDPAAWSSHSQTSTTGAADTPHTRVWTATSDATVQAIRAITTTRGGVFLEPTGVTSA